MSATLTTTQETAAPALTSWAIDKAHTQVGFAVKHLMISTVKGRFADFGGTVSLDNAGIAAADVSIGVASVYTGDEKRDAHLRSPDFFDADSFPSLTFRATRAEGDIDSKFVLHGDLTIRGSTRPVALSVINEGRGRDPWGGERIGFTASTKLNRKDFGLEWNVMLEAGGALVSDDVKVTIEGELVRQ